MTVVKKLGRYDIVRTLGKGAMGLVYEGKDSVLQRRVAIKTIIVENLDSKSAEEYEARFRTEALAAARLLHPNIVPVFDFGRHEDIAFLVMQYIEGDDLKHHIDRGERFAPQQAVAMMLDLLSALDHAHENNIVHRDIKPANMLIEKGRVKLTDFGVARIQDPDAANKTQVGAGGIGTPRYMSPEQAQGQRVDARSDLFSAGIVLYELLAGVRPFEGDNPFAIIHQIVSSVPPPPTYHNPRLPKAVDAVVAKALAKNRDERFSSAREFAMALKAAAQRLGTAPVPGGPPAQAGTGGNTAPTSPTSSRTTAPPRPPVDDDDEATRLPGQTGSSTSGPSGSSGTSGSLNLADKVVVSQDQTVISPEAMRVISTGAKAAVATQPATADATTPKLSPEEEARAAEEAAAAAARAAEAAKQLESLKAEKDFFVARAEAEAKARAKLEEETRQAAAAAPKRSKVPLVVAGVAVAGAIGAVVMFMGDKRAAEEAAAAATAEAKATAQALAAQQESIKQQAQQEAMKQAALMRTQQEEARKAEEARRAEELKKAADDPKRRAELEAKAKTDAEARAKADAEARARLEAETRAKVEAELRAKVEAEARARVEAEARRKAEEEARRTAAAPAAAPPTTPPQQPQQTAPQPPAQQVARVTLSPSQLLAQARDAEQAGRTAEAIRAYRQAAAAGSGAAAKRLNELYTNGGSGVERDAQQATFWANKARELGEQVQQSAGPCALRAGTTC